MYNIYRFANTKVCYRCTILYATWQEWVCEFCGSSTEADIVEEEKPCKADTTYLITPATVEGGGAMGKDSGVEDAMVIFCIDISGSMCVTTEVNTACLQASTFCISMHVHMYTVYRKLTAVFLPTKQAIYNVCTCTCICTCICTYMYMYMHVCVYSPLC